MNNAYSTLLKFTNHAKISIFNKYAIQGLTPLRTNKKFINMAATSQTTVIFQGTQDRFNGITVDSSAEKCNIDLFPKKLKESLKQWVETNKRGIWFKVALQQSNWIPFLVENGFDYHHAKAGYVMMNKWLPKEPSRLPVYAHTMLAVGALILNDNSEVLVVKEKNYMVSHWKFPGGLMEPGEQIVEAAKREVKEETNIDFNFESVVSFMHADKGMYSCSDLYIIVAGKALSTDIHKCEKEIADCRWIPIREYLQRDDITDFNKSLVQHWENYTKHGVKMNFIEGVHKLSKRNYTMYSIDFKE